MDEIINEVKAASKVYSTVHPSVKIRCCNDYAEDEDDLPRILYNFGRSAKQFNIKLAKWKLRNL